MNPPKSLFFYSAYGLTIQSEIALPELRSIQPVTKADITISLAELSDTCNFKKSYKDKNYWHGTQNSFYLHVANTAYFHVSYGKTILVETIAGSSDLDMHIHLLGSCMGVLIQQRNILPLHASCISMGKECVIISGQSGAGKSTLAMALNKKGYPLLSDDICALHFSKENIPHVYPSIPQIKIGPDSASALKVNTSNLSTTLSKCMVPIGNTSENMRHTIKAIFSIEQGDNDQLEIKELQGAIKIATLVKNTYTTPEIIKYLGKTSRHFEQCSILAKSYKVKQICRPTSLSNLPDLIYAIENEFTFS